MRVISVLLLSTALLHVHARQLLHSDEQSKEPWFCHGLDCPPYKVVNTTDKYEIREYKAGTYVLTTVEAHVYAAAVRSGFQKLFDYISGKNENNTKIAMTAPVATLIENGEGVFSKSNYTITFFVPFKYQEDPPKPTDPKVVIAKIPSCKAAVLQFGGFIFDDWRINSKAKTLKSYLDADSVAYKDASFFSVGYDPPTRITKRHNEIWLVLPDSEITKS